MNLVWKKKSNKIIYELKNEINKNKKSVIFYVFLEKKLFSLKRFNFLLLFIFHLGVLTWLQFTSLISLFVFGCFFLFAFIIFFLFFSFLFLFCIGFFFGVFLLSIFLLVWILLLIVLLLTLLFFSIYRWAFFLAWCYLCIILLLHFNWVFFLWLICLTT